MEQIYTTSVQDSKEGLNFLLFHKNFIHFTKKFIGFTCKLYKRVIQKEIRSRTCVRLQFTSSSSLTFTSSALDRKSLNINDQLSGFDNVGDGPVCIRRRAFNGGSWKWGGTPSAISIAVIPSDHTSTLFVYPSPWINSGDIQKGVPTLDLRCPSWDETRTANPKSASLTSPFPLIRMLSDLISRNQWKWNKYIPRWIWWVLWITHTAWRIHLQT